ncbi:MAG: ABC transporter permease, partial [Polaromonas sp.]
MNNKQLERWAPWVLLAAVVALWQAVCAGFSVPEFIFPAPLAIAQAMAEF